MGAYHRRQVQRRIENHDGETIAMGEVGRPCVVAGPDQDPQELILVGKSQ